MKIIANYHTHTYRCGHASGHEEEYIEAAIKGGLKILGFTDHVMLPGLVQPGIRGNFELLEGYISSLKDLKEKYKDQIKILIGLECEYYPQFVEYYKSLLNDYHLDYLILGQHCYLDENNNFHWYWENDTKYSLHHLVDDIIEGIKLGIFKYLAHPDMWVTNISKWTDHEEKEMIRLLEAVVKYDIPIEINLGHYNAREHFCSHLEYPYEGFWELASHYPVKVYIGRDAHSPDALLIENQNFDHALEIVKKYKLNLINETEE